MDITAQLQQKMHALQQPSDLDALIDRIGDARVVMLGEASHGTHEFYKWRRILSERLIAEKNFNFIAVEGDWPDCYRYNRYIKGYDTESVPASDVVGSYRRWPTWMWANTDVVELVDWLKKHNDQLPEAQKAGFYGLDVYSLWDSINATVDYIKQHHPESLEQAQNAYRCFEPYREDPMGYVYGKSWAPQSCQDEVVRMLVELIQSQPNDEHDPEAHFNAEQNAMVAMNAERYYKSMLGGQAESWNVRDHHMMGTLQRLMERHGKHAKAIIWAHNTHIGDARATDMAQEGMINIGQLVRETYQPEESFAVGFGAYTGNVIAAKYWDAEAEVMQVPKARPDSWDGLFHQASGRDGYVLLDQLTDTRTWNAEKMQRAIGVVYDPKRESYGNYVPTRLKDRYDAYIYLEETTALSPLKPETGDKEVPETYPSGV